MKVGLQTLPWQDGTRRLNDLVSCAKSLGYDGIELAQTVPSSECSAVADLLKSEGISLAGVSGGALSDRINFATSLRKSYPELSFYLYADEWGEYESQQYMDSGLACIVAVHPHMFKPIQTITEARKVMKSYSYARLLPDTAHLTVAGENIMAVLEVNLKDIVAIHVKDWTPEFGRALPFYSSGFVGLGEGIVPISSIVKFLLKVSYSGWLIVEQDFSVDPEETARKSREFLRNLGV